MENLTQCMESKAIMLCWMQPTVHNQGAKSWWQGLGNCWTDEKDQSWGQTWVFMKSGHGSYNISRTSQLENAAVCLPHPNFQHLCLLHRSHWQRRGVYNLQSMTLRETSSRSRQSGGVAPRQGCLASVHLRKDLMLSTEVVWTVQEKKVAWGWRTTRQVLDTNQDLFVLGFSGGWFMKTSWFFFCFLFNESNTTSFLKYVSFTYYIFIHSVLMLHIQPSKGALHSHWNHQECCWNISH